ncbi:leucyl/phenylalanyl-tRNA--protein transferase [Methylotenera versatilis]|uniref:Leucyl/phenylalanyl-tRNA--protein transferase n=1 Tax=Methylotenera versatilis (strain 301) TaxID=666681 RepID=D7DIV1_METV0|nr:leucyl/phenylalanyl-tRNA--protein transferase [Methylotenera versatilis]ADI29986.1 leucyl/phenylalanyl-tRNA/protein transferase [Methylotenera versatilis 301]
MSYAYYQLPSGRVASLEDDCEFPPLSMALKDPNGLIAIGGDLSATRLLEAYQQGIFPWFNEDEPVMWWSPSPRMVLFPDELKISNSLRKTLKKQPFEVRFNTNFSAVMTACSNTPRLDKNNNPAGTWISHEMIAAYSELNRLGYAISMESWLDNQLVGGCYGVKIGHMFYGESMFHHLTDASKVAFVHLVRYLQTQNVGLIDCQMKTPLLASFDGREIERDLFIQHLKFLVSA